MQALDYVLGGRIGRDLRSAHICEEHTCKQVADLTANAFFVTHPGTVTSDVSYPGGGAIKVKVEASDTSAFASTSV